MLENSSLDAIQAPVEMENDDICWICLDGTKDRDPLVSPCRCPRKVHPRCLARWQLQQAGRLEETNCRFCQCNLADWKASLTPDNLKPDVQRVQPIMVVYFEGQIHRIPVKQGPDGLKEFTHRIRELFRLPDDVDISLTFGCKEPLSGQHLKLEGIGAFDAAVHCASVAAAERQQKLRSGGGSAEGGAVSGGGAASAGAAAAATTAATASSGGASLPQLPSSSSSPAAAAASPSSPDTAAVLPNMNMPPSSTSASASANPTASRQRLHTHYHHHHQHPHHHQHQHQDQHQQQQQQQHVLEHRSASAALGAVLASSSAPASAQTSGGGADAGPPGLHPTASAPVLSHFASDFALMPPQNMAAVGATANGNIPLPALAAAAGSPPLPLEQQLSNPGSASSSSFRGYGSLSDEQGSAVHSARTSSGGGARRSRRGSLSGFEQLYQQQQQLAQLAQHALQHPQQQYPSFGGVQHSLADAGGLAPSPFQAAALDAAGRMARRVTGSYECSGFPSLSSFSHHQLSLLQRQLQHQQQQQQHYQQQQQGYYQHHQQHQQQQRQQQMLLASQLTAASVSGGSPSALAPQLSGVPPPLAAAISEPVPATRQSPTTPATPPPGAPSSPSYYQRHHHHHQQFQQLHPHSLPQLSNNPQRIQTPVELPYASAFPSSMTPVASPGSPYTSPILPSLPTGISAAGQQPAHASRPASPPSLATVATAAKATATAAVPPTPRDHYVCRATGSGSGQGHPGCTAQDEVAAQQQPHQQQRPEQQPWSSAAAEAASPPTNAAAEPSSKFKCLEGSAAPTTPVHAVSRRAAISPLSTTPVLPQPVTAAVASPPSSPTVSASGRHHPYPAAAATAAEREPLAAPPRGLSAGSGGICGEAAGTGGVFAAPSRNSRQRSASSSSGYYSSSSCQVRHNQRSNHQQLEYGNNGAAAALPSPAVDCAAAAADNTATLGSLTGRLKYSLRAFSKKVARSLNFQKGGHGSGHGHGASGGLVAGSAQQQQHPHLMSVSEFHVVEEDGAEAEVETAGGRTNCAAALAATTAVAYCPVSSAVTTAFSSEGLQQH